MIWERAAHLELDDVKTDGRKIRGKDRKAAGACDDRLRSMVVAAADIMLIERKSYQRHYVSNTDGSNQGFCAQVDNELSGIEDNVGHKKRNERKSGMR